MSEKQNTCIDYMEKRILYPSSPTSLYDESIYDNHTANRKCSRQIEGFSNVTNIWYLYIGVALILFALLGKSNRQIAIGIQSIAPVSEIRLKQFQ